MTARLVAKIENNETFSEKEDQTALARHAGDSPEAFLFVGPVATARGVSRFQLYCQGRAQVQVVKDWITSRPLGSKIAAMFLCFRVFTWLVFKPR